MGEWKEFHISELATSHSAARVPLSKMERESRRGSYPYYGASGVIDSVNDYLFDGEYVLISEDGENLKTRQTPIAFKAKGKFWVNNHAHVIQGHTEWLNDLLVYYFQNLDLSEYLTGAVQPKLNKANLESIKLLLPVDPGEQRAIASVLSSLDAKIDLLHRQNKTLEAMAETLFRQWFVEEAEEGWEERTVADIAEVTSGKRPPERFEAASNEARVPVWGGNGPMAYTREALVDSEVLLTGRVGTLGSIFRINTPIWPSDNTLLLTARAPEVQEFLFQQLKSIDFAQLNRGSTQPLLTQTDLKAQSFLMPPDELLMRYHKHSRDWYARVDANLKATQTLTALRDTLLPKLMSGEVRVEELTNV